MADCHILHAWERESNEDTITGNNTLKMQVFFRPHGSIRCPGKYLPESFLHFFSYSKKEEDLMRYTLEGTNLPIVIYRAKDSFAFRFHFLPHYLIVSTVSFDKICRIFRSGKDCNTIINS